MSLPSRWMGGSPEGRWSGVAYPSNNTAQLWRIEPSPEYRTFVSASWGGDSTLLDGDISPDGTLLAMGASYGVRFWDIAQGSEVAHLEMGNTPSVCLRSGGMELLTCGPGAGLQRWRFEAAGEIGKPRKLRLDRRIPLPFVPTRMSVARDKRTLAVVGEHAGQCVIVDLVSETVRGEMPHENAGFVAMSPDGERVVTSGWHSKQVKVWDGTSGRLITELEHGSSARVFFTPDNRELIVARDREFTFYDLSSLAVTRRLPREIGLYPGHVAFTADGRMMALEMTPGIIHLKEVTSGRTVARLEDPNGDLSTWIGFTPDGTQLVVAARYAGAIHRWDLRAIRARLKTMNLDWDWPEFPVPPPGDSFARKNRLRQIEIVGAGSATISTSATNAPPAHP